MLQRDKDSIINHYIIIIPATRLGPNVSKVILTLAWSVCQLGHHAVIGGQLIPGYSDCMGDAYIVHRPAYVCNIVSHRHLAI